MRKFNRPTDHRVAMIKNLATNLLWYGKIETTTEKAKDVQVYAEKMLTKAINTSIWGWHRCLAWVFHAIASFKRKLLI